MRRFFFSFARFTVSTALIQVGPGYRSSLGARLDATTWMTLSSRSLLCSLNFMVIH